MRLTPVWRFATGDLQRHPDIVDGWRWQATPVLSNGLLVICTPRNEVLALDPGTGAQVWRYDPKVDDAAYAPGERVCRGVAAFTDKTAMDATPCKSRIITATIDRRLIALDAKTGAPCPGFGTNGVVAVTPEKPLRFAHELMFASAPTIVRETIVMGSAITDGERVDAPSGMVRGFDVRTGALKWTFDPIPRSADDPRTATWGADSWRTAGAANAWAPISADEARGVVYIPTGSASPDYFGGTRPGDNRDANSIIALDAQTGARLWAFQTVRHDVWDYDVSAPPVLTTILRNGQSIDALVQVTKMGFVFVLNRDTGEPIFPIEERAFAQGGVPEEALSPTQPVPTVPAPLVPNEISAFGLTPFDRGACEQLIGGLRFDGLFTPPSTQGTIIHPFSGGGANWGGPAIDPNRRVLIVNTSDAAEFARLIPREKDQDATFDGKRFPQAGAPYTLDRGIMRSPLGAPCTQPPWGRLHAIDLDTGEALWTRPLGTFEDLIPFGDLLLPRGTPNLGGPLITGSGLIFIGATMDNYLRAFDIETGAELWKGRLPGGGQATPMTYEWEGRQYVVIAAGGHGGMNSKPGDQIIAFALTDRGPGWFSWWERPTPRAGVLGLGGLIMLLGLMVLAFRAARRRMH